MSLQSLLYEGIDPLHGLFADFLKAASLALIRERAGRKREHRSIAATINACLFKGQLADTSDRTSPKSLTSQLALETRSAV